MALFVSDRLLNDPLLFLGGGGATQERTTRVRRRETGRGGRAERISLTSIRARSSSSFLPFMVAAVASPRHMRMHPLLAHFYGKPIPPMNDHIVCARRPLPPSLTPDKYASGKKRDGEGESCVQKMEEIGDLV